MTLLSRTPSFSGIPLHAHVEPHTPSLSISFMRISQFHLKWIGRRQHGSSFPFLQASLSSRAPSSPPSPSRYPVSPSSNSFSPLSSAMEKGRDYSGKLNTEGNQQFLEELRLLLALLPERVRMQLECLEESKEQGGGGARVAELVEIVLDLGRRPLARFPDGDFHIAEEVVTAEEIEYAAKQVGEFGGDNRAGIDRTLHRISAIRNRSGKIVGLTCRVGRAISGSAEMVRDLVAAGGSLLLMGPPGVGKTTAIREVARLLSDEYLKRVVIVDTSNEIGGDGDISHAGIGRARRMQVPQVEMQHEVMIEAVENHMPQTIVIDEIGTELESLAAGTIAQRGVQLVGTAHGTTVENLIKNPSLQNLAGGIQSVTLGDEEARRRGVQKSVLERQGPPVFTAAVEMVSRSEWRVHRSLASTVDALLAGRSPAVEIRRMDENGRLLVGPTKEGVGEWRVGGEGEGEGFDSSSDSDDNEDEGESETDVSIGRFSIQKKDKGNSPLLLYTYQIAEGILEQVLAGMGLRNTVELTEDIGMADAVLALRSKLKHNTWIRGMAKYRQLPIFAIKANTAAQMVRAMRAITGLDTISSVGGMNSAGGGRGGRGQVEEEMSTQTLKWVAVGNRSTLEDGGDAIEEAKMAVEQLVLPLNQPVELLPRSLTVLDLQTKLILEYGLHVERVGLHPNCRLRILPLMETSLNSKKDSLLLGDTRGRANREHDAELSDPYVKTTTGAGFSVDRLPVLEDDC